MGVLSGKGGINPEMITWTAYCAGATALQAVGAMASLVFVASF